MDTLPQPQVGPPDSDGFRTFSLYAPNGEIFRVSFNVETQREFLDIPVSFDDAYSPSEQQRLKMAADVAILRGEVPQAGGSPSENKLQEERAAVELLHAKANETAARMFEQWFPALATLALTAASNACVKRSLNQVMADYGTPRIYDEAAFDRLLDDFKIAIRREMVVRPGHQLEGPERLAQISERIHSALQRLNRDGSGTQATQEDVAQEMKIDERLLRTWAGELGGWERLLSRYQWQPKRKKRKAAAK